ncbi:Oligopeptide transporter 1 [Tripterygium wilfordii]|uniref:Oligopeptide transporter 1 n=1 Tax=Tripterygium wilfordii TaxID=458696 RepID=A0A7J7C3T7_TRIWF|nr:Oligopeptide transporter 1 [Tripterygium wilfordii]
MEHPEANGIPIPDKITKEALHEIERRPKGGLTRLQFFLVVLLSSFAYYIVPNYLFPSITALSFVCWIWKKSVTAQQIGGGLRGLGIGSFGLDWATVAGFLGTPLATPGFAIINIMVGFFLIVYVMIPIAYWTNSYEAKRFPIFSSHVFNATGGEYDVSTVLNSTTFEFNQQGYDGYSQVNLSIFFVFSYGLSFATLAATLSHVVLFHGRWSFKYFLETTKLSSTGLLEFASFTVASEPLDLRGLVSDFRCSHCSFGVVDGGFMSEENNEYIGGRVDIWLNLNMIHWSRDYVLDHLLPNDDEHASPLSVDVKVLCPMTNFCFRKREGYLPAMPGSQCFTGSQRKSTRIVVDQHCLLCTGRLI